VAVLSKQCPLEIEKGRTNIGKKPTMPKKKKTQKLRTEEKKRGRTDVWRGPRKKLALPGRDGCGEGGRRAKQKSVL